MKNARIRKSVFAVITVIVCCRPLDSAGLPDRTVLREGDIIFQESVSEQCRAVQLATRSRYTHAGIIFTCKGRFMVLEAVQPVRITSLDSFIRRGVGGHYVIKRLKNRDRVIGPAEIKKMKSTGASFLGKNYDIYFGWSDERVYCTELIWKIYKRALGVEVGALKKLSSFDLSHPAVKKLMRKRYGSNIPYDEPVISPQGMFEATNLATVATD